MRGVASMVSHAWWQDDREPASKVAVFAKPKPMRKVSDIPEFMKLKLVAEKLGVSIWVVYRWIKTGELEAQRVGGGYRVSVAALADFLERQRTQRF